MLELKELKFEGYTAGLTTICAVSLLVWWISGGRAKRTLPGPKGFPIIGNIIELSRKLKTGGMAKYQMELHKKYGPLAFVPAGVQRVVFIGNGALLADLYQREEFALRPIETFPVFTRLSHGSPRGLIFGNGEPHKEMRRFALLSLRDFGVGKKSIDEMIQTEASILSQHLANLAETKDGVMSDLKIKMQYATANIIHHILFGYRQEYEDPEWRALVKAMYEFFGINLFAFPENFFPILQKFPLINGYFSDDLNNKFFTANCAVEKYLDQRIDDHRATYIEGETRDFIDLYLKYEKEQKEHYFKENIYGAMLDLFRAGTETTATTLTWSIMYLVKNQQLQQSLRDEIDEVVGEGVFNRKDKDKLIKTRAFLYEVHRFVSIAVVVAPHTVSKPVSVEDLTLLPDDVIFGSLFNIHHDKDYWGDPSTFRIDRWIDENGELKKHEGHYYPFSVGKRACPGRQLAMIEVMLILVEFLQKFRFEVAKGYESLPDEQRPGLIRGPQNFHVKVIKRF